MTTLLAASTLAMALAGPTISVRDMDGKPVTLPVPGRVTCLLFVAPDCPIANRLAPELRRIVRDHAKVSFYLVYPSAGASKAAAAKHRKAFALSPPAILDPKFRIAKFARATVTPEATVFGIKGQAVYRGLINDLFTEHNVANDKPSKNFLRDGLAAALEGRGVEPNYLAPVGCPIPFP